MVVRVGGYRPQHSPPIVEEYMSEQAQSSAENPQLRDITIQGQELEIEVPYAEGHILTKPEAAQLNQVYLENIGNNFRKKVQELLEGGAATEAIQAALNTYADEYVFGTRRSAGSGPRKAADPVLREARILAKRALTDFFKKKELNFADLTSEEKEAAIKEYFVRHGDRVMEIAARRVADAAAINEAGM